MKIGILSDTHDRIERTRKAITLLLAKEAQVFFHCGDLTSSDLIAPFESLNAYFVMGNNDQWEIDLIKHEIEKQKNKFLDLGGMVEIDNKKIAVTHGHLSRVKRELLKQGPDYLLLGHAHKQQDERVGKTRIINPGALHRVHPKTCALLDLKSDSLEFIVVED